MILTTTVFFSLTRLKRFLMMADPQGDDWEVTKRLLKIILRPICNQHSINKTVDFRRKLFTSTIELIIDLGIK